MDDNQRRKIMIRKTDVRELQRVKGTPGGDWPFARGVRDTAKDFESHCVSR